jgi:hypothetical protein
MFHSNLPIDSNERNCKEFGVRNVRSEGKRRSNAEQNERVRIKGR